MGCEYWARPGGMADCSLVRVTQCSMGDGVIGSVDCGVIVIQNILLSGWAFNKLPVIGEFMAEITFVKVAENDI